MAGPLLDAKITTKNARAALSPGTHWRSIDPDIHLGYRKQKRGGRWVVRWYVGDKKYQQGTLGTADDLVAEGNLNFEQAIKQARETVTGAREQTACAALAPPETVRSVLDVYIKMRNARRSAQLGREARSDAASRLGLHVFSHSIVDIELALLTEDDLSAWKGSLNPVLKATSHLRTLSDFKSALNAAHQKHRKQLPPEFGDIIRYGLSRDEPLAEPVSGARDNQILDDDIVRKVMKRRRHTMRTATSGE